MDARFAIGTLSTRTGCKVETVRYYERIGLLPRPARSAGGYRLYTLDQVKRLTFIRRGRDLGFTLDDVRRLLALADERERPCAQVRDVAAAHLEDVRAKLRGLRSMEAVLTRIIAQCAGGTRPDCPLIEALSEAPADAGGADRPRVRDRRAASRRSPVRAGRPPRRSVPS